MLQKDRLYRVQEKMKQAAMPQMLVTDPMAIYWLCGKLFAPGERFLGLLLQTKEEPPAVLIVNELFRFDEELGIPMVWYSDTDDVTAVLKPLLRPEEKLCVDQTMAAKFLIGLMEGNAAAGYVNGSFTIDETRAVKDAAEQEKLRQASLVNDAAMEKFKASSTPASRNWKSRIRCLASTNHWVPPPIPLIRLSPSAIMPQIPIICRITRC